MQFFFRRGPDKYQRSWENPEDYFAKQNNPGRGKGRRTFVKEEFPPLPNRKLKKIYIYLLYWVNFINVLVEKNEAKGENQTPVKEKDKSPWKNNADNFPKNKIPSSNEHEKASSQPQHNHHSNLPGFHSNKKPNPNFNRRINENDIRPFKNDGNKFRNNMKSGRYDGKILKTH